MLHRHILGIKKENFCILDLFRVLIFFSRIIKMGQSADIICWAIQGALKAT